MDTTFKANAAIDDRAKDIVKGESYETRVSAIDANAASCSAAASSAVKACSAWASPWSP